MRGVAVARWALHRRATARGLVPSRRLSAAAQLAVDPSPASLPDPPRPTVRSLKGKERERIAFSTGASEISLEQREFFSSDVDIEVGSSADTEGEEYGALLPGRVVECRRSGLSTLGLILTPIVISGRPRLLILQSRGDVWATTPADVQFLFPPSLIPADVAEACWSPELNKLYDGSTESGLSDLLSEEMLVARRKVVTILRKVMRETEKMSGRLLMDGGSMDQVWDHFAPSNPQDRGRVSARDAAQYLFDLERKGAPQNVKPNTLPAFAAHELMMMRSDLFLADQGQMWESGLFLIRSREERERLRRVLGWIEGSTEEDKEILESFLDKARSLVNTRQAGETPRGVTWISSDLDIIHAMLLRLYETRSTQWSPSEKMYILVLKALGTYPRETVDLALLARFMSDIGVLAPYDSLELSKEQESLHRRMVTAGISLSSSKSGDLMRGDELDTIREDFSSQRVFVIDDPGALELDDGVAFEPLPNGDAWIHVHVADPTRFLPPDHPLAIEASFRGSATYLPEGNKPLLPIPEVMEHLSLGAATSGGGPAVLTLSALLGPDAEVKDSKVRLGWIRTPTVITYEAVDLALGLPIPTVLKPFGTPPIQKASSSGKDVDEGDVGILREMHKMAVKYRRKRLATAGLEFPLAMGTTSLIDSPLPPTRLFERASLASHLQHASSPVIDYSVPTVGTSAMSSGGMVAEFMILGGRIAAHFLASRNILGPFRGVEAPQPLGAYGKAPVSLQEVLAERDQDGYLDPFRAFSYNLYQSASTVSTTPVNHWAMGFTGNDHGYVRATSPLRRYDDLLVHWQIKAALAGDRQISIPYRSFDAGEMEMLAKRSAAAQRSIKRASKTVNLYWQAGLIKSRQFGPAPADWTASDSLVDLKAPIMGRIARQTAVELGRGTTQVYLGALGLMAEMRTLGSKRYTVGEEILVTVGDVIQWPSPRVQVVPA